MLPRTQRQKEVLDYIVRFLASHGHEPSYAQIARYFGVSSKATIAKHISALEKRGLIEREHQAGRFSLKVEVEEAAPDAVCELWSRVRIGVVSTCNAFLIAHQIGSGFLFLAETVNGQIAASGNFRQLSIFLCERHSFRR